tara:strand:+ start:5143 stop:5388 length:246 start_codon:yes stop_codon:yes gene_type:complete
MVLPSVITDKQNAYPTKTEGGRRLFLDKTRSSGGSRKPRKCLNVLVIPRDLAEPFFIMSIFLKAIDVFVCYVDGLLIRINL